MATTLSANLTRQIPAHRCLMWRNLIALLVFCASLALYLFTAEPTVSYWDCPEYVTTAARLEPGHPPGNPVWMLTARMFTLLAQDTDDIAFSVNAMSGVCSAVAVMLLFLTLVIMFRRLRHIAVGSPMRRGDAIAIYGGAAIGAAILAVSDTFWFSAIEAEVYSFSSMLTALTLYLVFLWGENRHRPYSARYLVLTAYITGLSIGVHQLNLLTLPALALAMVFFTHSDLRRRVVAAAVLLSLIVIAAILFAMMPASLLMACRLELWAVNDLGMPIHSGPLAYIAMTVAAIIAAAAITQRGPVSVSGLLTSIAAIWLCGIFSFGGNPVVGIVIAAIVAAVCILRRKHINAALLNTAVWCAAFLFLGYCSYAVIIIRGAAHPTMNQSNADNIFALRSYIDRDQYGSNPLIYGPTPYSEPLYEEDIETDSVTHSKSVHYTRFARRTTGENFTPVDSAGRVKYVSAGLKQEIIYAPELNMWFPRIYSSNPDDIESYRGWTGMTKENMRKVEVSYARDSTGKAVGKLILPEGKRIKETQYKPTVAQNIMLLFGYQMSYMYLRYLMWNFVGRQNEVYAQGEADAGNFITGIPPVDRLMLQHPEKMPRDIGSDNPGHHNYLMLPLLLGIAGIICQLNAGKRGRRQFTLTALLFVLTGAAIAVYLNQTPGEPRERDYSFVGSFYSFCLWTGIGAAACIRLSLRLATKHGNRQTMSIVRRCAAVALTALTLSVPVVMAVENFDDHDRRGRYLTRDFGRMSLNSVPPRGVIFVNGDNFTFPLWYLQEVEQYRPDVAIVNIAYLSTLWYPGQLAMEQPSGRALKFSLPADSLRPDILYRFGVADIGRGTLDAREALRRLFTSPPTNSRPRIPADSLLFPPLRPDDTPITIALRDIAEGHSYLRLDKLMMLDIVANNRAMRPLTWHITVPENHTAGMKRHTTVSGLARVLSEKCDTAANIRLWLDAPALGNARYIDLPGRQQTAILRRQITLAADAALITGDTVSALRLARMSETKLPPTLVPYTCLTNEGNIYSEAVDLGRIYLRCGHKEDARRLARLEIERCAAYHDYLASLSPRYARFTKATTRLSRNNLHAPLQLWIDAGDDPKQITADPRYKHIDFK